MNVDDITPKNVTGLFVNSLERFQTFADEITPKALRDPDFKAMTLLGIPVLISNSAPDNMIVVRGPAGNIMGYIEMFPKEPTAAVC